MPRARPARAAKQAANRKSLRMSSSTGVTDDIGAALCQEQSVMLGVSWLFSVIWFIMFSVWVGVLVTSCRVRQVRCLQVVMLIVPFFHLGDAIWQLWTYTHCQCMQCHFTSYTAIWVWIGAQYTFSLGRLTALLLCLFLISTGAGTVRMSLLTRNWAELFVLFAGFVLSMALGLPLTVVMLGTDSMAAFIASIIFYGLILMTIFVEAYGNARVLKAQLVMIRAQGIAPRTTPAFAKFRMFTRLRRWVFGYFVMHTFIIIAQIVQMQLWERVTLLVVWELAQIAVTTIFSLAFSKSAAYVPLVLPLASRPRPRISHRPRPRPTPRASRPRPRPTQLPPSPLRPRHVRERSAGTHAPLRASARAPRAPLSTPISSARDCWRRRMCAHQCQPTR